MHAVVVAVVSLSVAAVSATVAAQSAVAPGGSRAGKDFIATPVYSAEDDARLLALFDGLRVADVTDGMDAVGLQNIGLMDPGIRPLWKDPKTFTHRFVGIAVTARYVPTQRPSAGKRMIADYDAWAGQWYN